ncbi:uncharacterized protein LOC128676441 [Plodia interpunctella]|uniref:uncharacterized protein LOC128676441 n=1 Tax=Plodia interpunctella TaxID=58824 RepID=UPI0023674764|nr:uncharacterized protein LOC128676441 isoform X1 [Plodia interpunctella]
MALMRSKEIPEDAVVLDEVDAVSYAWEVVSNWESISDTWALKYGPPILGGINAIAGIIINNHYRTKLKLGTYGFYSSVIPITLMPGILTTLFHRHIISSKILIMKSDCPICYEMRSAGIQLGLGLAYPMILAPASAMMFANRYATYRLPDLTFDGPKKVFQLVRNITRPFYGTVVTLSVCQFIASSLVTFFELKNNFALRKKLIELENQLLVQNEDSI